LELFRRNRLSPDELLRVDEHLSSCERCRTALAHAPDVRASALRLENALTGTSSAELGHLTYSELESFADISISRGELERINSHIAACAECRNDAEELRSLAHGGGADGPAAVAPAAAVRESWWQRLSATLSPKALAFAAAAILLVIVAASTWVFLGGRDEGRNTDVVATNSAPAQDQPGAGRDVNSRSDSNADAAAPTPDESPAASSEEFAKDPRVGEENGGIDPLLNALAGYENLSPQQKQKVERVLRTGDVEIAKDLGELRSASGATMGGETGDTDKFRLLGPVGEVILTDRPRLSWEAVPGAESYSVEVYDLNFNRQASSGPLRGNQWTASRLPRGKTYIWQVTAVKDGKEIRAPQRPAPEARFRIVGSGIAAEIEAARRKRPVPHLLLGTLYAEAGMLKEALREFELLARKNPGSQLPRKLADKIRSQNRLR